MLCNKNVKISLIFITNKTLHFKHWKTYTFTQFTEHFPSNKYIAILSMVSGVGAFPQNCLSNKNMQFNLRKYSNFWEIQIKHSIHGRIALEFSSIWNVIDVIEKNIYIPRRYEGLRPPNSSSCWRLGRPCQVEVINLNN